MDLEYIMLSEISQTEKDKFCMISLICGIQKIKQMNVYSKRETYRYRKQASDSQCGERRGERKNRGMGLKDTNYYVKNKQQEYIIQHREL